MTINQAAEGARRFAAMWAGHGYERGEAQPFWTSLLRTVYGIADPETFISFERRVRSGAHVDFIDAYIADTKVLIEQKSSGKDLRAPVRQSDGSMLTPYHQAMRYIAGLPLSQHPKWIVCCNFGEFMIYDMEDPDNEALSFRLEELPDHAAAMSFLVDLAASRAVNEAKCSMEAGRLIGRLYDALRAARGDNPDEGSLDTLCIRLAFCLYMEDAGMMRKSQFHDLLEPQRPADIRYTLQRIFRVLDAPYSDRDPYEDAELAALPYVNGGLFAEDLDRAIPPFDAGMKALLVDTLSAGFDWSGIQPSVFGSIFESCMNPDMRRREGMHYTSVENIRKVTGPLFMDALNRRADEALSERVWNLRVSKLEALQRDMAAMVFLDPACGSGNFLTDTYLQLRRLENAVIRQLRRDGREAGVMLSIRNFKGIELNRMAQSIATVAMWIAEAQAANELCSGGTVDDMVLPLKDAGSIVCGDALQLDWLEVCGGHVDFIMGNPPYKGGSTLSAEQREAVDAVLGKGWQGGGMLDLCAAWYVKAARIIQANPVVKAAFVTTNSVCQGVQATSLWKPILTGMGVEISFARRSFKWTTEGERAAAVHVIVVGLGSQTGGLKPLYDGDSCSEVQCINQYLEAAAVIFVEPSRLPVSPGVHEMRNGSKPTDGGHLFLDAEEHDELLSNCPSVASYIRKFVGAEELLNGADRWCLWFEGLNGDEAVLRLPAIAARLDAVRAVRAASAAATTRADAATPWLFQAIKQPADGSYIAVPRVSSENRDYMQLDFLPNHIICGNSMSLIPDVTLYDFAILESSAHHEWMKMTTGRLESRFRYSNTQVYNTFPWPVDVTDEQRRAVENAGQSILYARQAHAGSTLAYLYNRDTMPEDLLAAHKANDALVLGLYGLPANADRRTVLNELLRRYRALTEVQQ